MNDTPNYDVLIAGAGIVGLASAWQLARKRPDLRIAIVEKEPRPAMHQSSRNSGVIHSGIYYTPGSAKAINCLKGYRMLLEFADAYKVPYRICGKIIAAIEDAELPVLHEIHQRGIAHGLNGIELLDAAASKNAEPHVQAMQSIWVPQAGIIDFGSVCTELMRQLQNLGVTLYFDHEIMEFRRELHHVAVTTRYGDFNTALFVNCCGLYADRIALLTGMSGRFRILPFRGEFYRVTGSSAGLVRHLVYPVPDERFPFLGVHLTLRMDGGLEAGPNAVLAFSREGYRLRDFNAGDISEMLTFTGFYRMAYRYWKKGWQEMYRSFSKDAFLRSMRHLVPAVKAEDVEYRRSGVRAQCVGADGKMIYDYLMLEDPQILNVVNAPSPAATSALAIGEFIADKTLSKLSTAE